MAGTFVEIGSCDFDNYDILLLDGWKGYFVEPVPEYLVSLFDRLLKLQEDRGKRFNATFTNGAISNFTGTGQIRYVPPGDTAWWVKGLGHVNGSKNNGIEIREELQSKSKLIDVQFYTLDDYFKLMNLKSVDIMKVDVEGHELEVFNNYSWQIKPKHIKIEYTFVGLDPVVSMLESQGYECTFDNEDVFGTFKG